MKNSLPISHVAEQVAEYMYNMSIPEQTEMLRCNFGIDIEDTDDGVVWEGKLITDSQFDSLFMEIVENMSYDTIIDLWRDYVGFDCELDEDNNVVWED
jgi:hypothetical protein